MKESNNAKEVYNFKIKYSPYGEKSRKYSTTVYSARSKRHAINIFRKKRIKMRLPSPIIRKIKVSG